MNTSAGNLKNCLIEKQIRNYLCLILLLILALLVVDCELLHIGKTEWPFGMILG